MTRPTLTIGETIPRGGSGLNFADLLVGEVCIWFKRKNSCTKMAAWRDVLDVALLWLEVDISLYFLKGED